MCSFQENVKYMTFSNCNLFKRSFTNRGLGFTFNNDIQENLFKKIFGSKAFFTNTKRKPSMMSSASTEDALRVVLENNHEEVHRYEEDRENSKLQPTKVKVSLHNPVEPADIRTNSFEIPLGHSTIVYVTPKATEVDEGGKQLTEIQRNCRLADDTDQLDIFNVYTRSACMFECKIRHSIRRCGCVPWNYPNDKEKTILLFNISNFSILSTFKFTFRTIQFFVTCMGMNVLKIS